MVTQQKAREHIARAVLTDPRMPSELDFLLQEADSSGSDAYKTLPLLLVEFESTSRPDHRNSNLVGYKQNNAGERIAEVFEREWEATAHIELWTADGSDYDVDELADTLISILYGYETKTTDDPFLDENGDTVDGLWHFELQDGFRADDLVQTPSVRRFRQVAHVYGAHEYVSEEIPPVEVVDPEVKEEDAKDIKE
jgi:hypothetical protein